MNIVPCTIQEIFVQSILYIVVCICYPSLLIYPSLFSLLVTISLFSYIYKLINFNWRLITLQYCGGFCHTSTWSTHGCNVSPILNSHKFVFYVCEFLFCIYIYLYFFRYHIKVMVYNICFSLSDLLYEVWYPLGSSMLLQMAILHPSVWLSNIHMDPIFLSQPSVDGHLGCFLVLAM